MDAAIAAALAHADELDEQLIATVEKLRASEAENEALRDRLKALEELLVCYRIGKQPTERLHRALAATSKRLADLDSR